MRVLKIVVCCSLLLAIFWPLSVLAEGGQSASEPIRHSVQEFYDWYVPKTLNESSQPAWNQALKQRVAAFSTELFHALEADSEAQVKVTGDIVGLDFDPFLGSQDPCERYQVGKITQNGSTYSVEIYGICSGKKDKKPDVVAELTQKNDRWLFVNFDYPQGGNLLAILKSLQKSRQKEPR
jgi:hypothetical protein